MDREENGAGQFHGDVEQGEEVVHLFFLEGLRLVPGTGIFEERVEPRADVPQISRVKHVELIEILVVELR
jgi:hypothetical protein